MPSKFKWVYFCFLSCLLTTLACKQSSKEVPETSNGEADFESEAFKTFYEKFSTDSAYQMDHIVFPLEGVRSLTDSLQKQDPDFKWQQNEWILHKPYNDQNGTFSREFKSMNGLVIEKITDMSGTYSMERRFGKLSAGWHLIYYREMGPY